MNKFENLKIVFPHFLPSGGSSHYAPIVIVHSLDGDAYYAEIGGHLVPAKVTHAEIMEALKAAANSSGNHEAGAAHYDGPLTLADSLLAEALGWRIAR